MIRKMGRDFEGKSEVGNGEVDSSEIGGGIIQLDTILRDPSTGKPRKENCRIHYRKLKIVFIKTTVKPNVKKSKYKVKNPNEKKNRYYNFSCFIFIHVLINWNIIIFTEVTSSQILMNNFF